MSKRQRGRWRRRITWVQAVATRLRQTAGRLWQTMCRRCRRVQIEVMISDKEERRTLEWEVRRGLGRMQRVLGTPLPAELAVVVQQVVQSDRQLAGCYQFGQGPDGSRFALVRLALQVDGQRLGVDELLSVLAEQCIGLAIQQDGGFSVLVPVELNVAQPGETSRLTAFQSDPLAAHRNGAAPIERSA